MAELHYESLTDVAARIARGEITAEAVARHLLERIDRLEPRLHSYVRVLREEALAQARVADREIRAGLRRGPLHGVPVAIKDILLTAAAPTTAGSTFLAEHLPRRDSTIVTRLARAGAVLLGKHALTEGALSEHRADRPVPVNPWHADYWTGVSSSGSGVATAAGLCFASVGTDTGGSIRMPSAANGLSGIKPTFGRVSRDGLFPLCEGRDHAGPLARSVADAAAMLGVLAGADAKDPTTLPQPVDDYLAAIGRGIEGVRIGVDRAVLDSIPDPELAAAIDAAIDELAALGARIVAVAYPAPDDYLRLYFAETAAEVALTHAPYFPAHADAYGAVLRGTIERGASVSGQDVARVQQARMRFCGALATLFADIDILLLPLLPHGTLTVAQMAQQRDPAEFILTRGRFTLPFNASGNPALVLPCGFGGNGMPLSLQMIGRHLEESVLFRAGHAYQRVTDWHTRHPALD